MLVFLLTLAISFILEILEVTILSYPLGFLWLISYSLFESSSKSFYLSFLSGLWLDFLKGEVFGRTALIFLIFSFLVYLYKRKLKVHHPLYFFPFILSSYLVFNFFEFGEVHLLRFPFSFLLAFIFFKIIKVLAEKKEEIKF